MPGVIEPGRSQIVRLIFRSKSHNDTKVLGSNAFEGALQRRLQFWSFWEVIAAITWERRSLQESPQTAY